VMVWPFARKKPSAAEKVDADLERRIRELV
jgi:hypothetical protein